MSQIIGNPAAGIGGIFLGAGIGGPVVHLIGSGDPNTLTDGSVTGAAVGSLWSRLDAPDSTHALYVKTAAAGNTWTAK